jgi:hypothetical protein
VENVNHHCLTIAWNPNNGAAANRVYNVVTFLTIVTLS